MSIPNDKQHLPPNFLAMRHPCRVILSGPTDSGKTVTALRLIENASDFFQLLIVVVPSFWTQETYAPLRYLADTDALVVFPYLNGSTMSQVHKIITQEKDDKRILVLIDDQAGEKASNTGRFGLLQRIANNCRHMNVSLLCCVQHQTGITPSFRDNSQFVIQWFTANRLERRRLYEEYSGSLSLAEFTKVLEKAWSQGTGWIKPFSPIILQKDRTGIFCYDITGLLVAAIQ